MEYAFGHMMPVRDRARFLPLYDAMAVAAAAATAAEASGGGGGGGGAEGGVERSREFHLRSTFVHNTKTRPWTASHQRRVTAAAASAAAASSSFAFGSGASTARAAAPASPSAMTSPSPRALLGAEPSPARPQTAPLQLSPRARCAPFFLLPSPACPVCLLERRAHSHARRRMEVTSRVRMRALVGAQLRGGLSECTTRPDRAHRKTPSAQTRQSIQCSPLY